MATERFIIGYAMYLSPVLGWGWETSLRATKSLTAGLGWLRSVLTTTTAFPSSYSPARNLSYLSSCSSTGRSWHGQACLCSFRSLQWSASQVQT